MPTPAQMIQWLLIGTPILVVLFVFLAALAGGLMAPIRSAEITHERHDD